MTDPVTTAAGRAGSVTTTELKRTGRSIVAGTWGCAGIVMVASAINAVLTFSALGDNRVLGLATGIAVDIALCVALVGDRQLYVHGLSSPWGRALRVATALMSLVLNAGVAFLDGHLFVGVLHSFLPILLILLTESGQSYLIHFTDLVRAADNDKTDIEWIEADGVTYQQAYFDDLAAEMGQANRERDQAKAELSAATTRAHEAETAASAHSRELARLGSQLASERAARAAEQALRDFECRAEDDAVPAREEPSRSVGPGDDDLIERVRQLVTESTVAGRPMGRRAIAKQLDTTEHRVRVALELVGATTGPALNGTGNSAQSTGHPSAGP
jgi:hypothetical protein